LLLCSLGDLGRQSVNKRAERDKVSQIDGQDSVIL